MNPFRARNPDSPKTPPASPPRKATKVLFRTSSAGERDPNSAAQPESPPPAAAAMASVQHSPPSSPSKRPPLTIGNVANIFVKMRRASDQVKPWHIHSSSGDEPQSHPGIAEAATDPTREPLRQADTYICEGGVNVAQLLRATRNALLEEAEAMGATALVDEQWNCTVCGPKHRPNGTFKVQITYTASAVLSDYPDPRRPIALDKVNGVPGLMTVIKRISE